MQLKRRLLRRPRPYPDESLAGYIIRLSEANYYESPQRIFQLSGLRQKVTYVNIFAPEKDDLSQLSLICDVPENILWSMTFPVVTPHPHRRRQTIKVFGNVVSLKTLEYLWVKLCPICLQASPYYRLIWNLSAVTVCPFHYCLLIERCPACQLPIEWFNSSVVRCSCQFDWRNHQPEAVLSEQLTKSRQIYQLCQIADLPDFHSELISLHHQSEPDLDWNSLVNLLEGSG